MDSLEARNEKTNLLALHWQTGCRQHRFPVGRPPCVLVMPTLRYQSLFPSRRLQHSHWSSEVLPEPEEPVFLFIVVINT